MRWKNVFGVLLLLVFGFVLGATYDQFVGSPKQILETALDRV